MLGKAKENMEKHLKFLLSGGVDNIEYIIFILVPDIVHVATSEKICELTQINDEQTTAASEKKKKRTYPPPLGHIS